MTHDEGWEKYAVNGVIAVNVVKDLLVSQRSALIEEVEKEVKRIEADGLTVGLERQSRVIIDRLYSLLSTLRLRGKEGKYEYVSR